MHLSKNILFVTSFVSILLSTSVSAQQCVNSRLPFPFGKRKASCKDIGGTIKNKACKNVKFASHCPKTCGACKEFKCADSKKEFIRKGINRSCDWLNGLSPNKKEQRCMSRRIKQTCRSTCEYCAPKEDFLDFDDVKVDEIMKFVYDEDTSLLFGNTLVVNSDWIKEGMPQLPWDDLVTTKPNLAGRDSTDEAVYMACFGGSFTLKSMMLAPLFSEDKYNYYNNKNGDDFDKLLISPSAMFAAYDKDWNLVEEIIVNFDEIGEVKRVEFPPEFQDVGGVVLYGAYQFGVIYGFDTLDVKINYPCSTEYYSLNSVRDVVKDSTKHGPSTSSGKGHFIW